MVEFVAIALVLFASKFGVPIYATRLVGGVMAVAFSRGLNKVRSETMKEIAALWLVIIPVGATLSLLHLDLN